MANIDVDQLQTFSPADLLKITNHAIAMILMSGQSYTINGRTFTKANLVELYELRRNLELETGDETTKIAAVNLNMN